MGPWWNPYRDGPDPALVIRKRQEMKCRNIVKMTAALREAFLEVGRAAVRAGDIANSTVQEIRLRTE